MSHDRQSGYYLMELAVIIPIVFSLALGLTDAMNILTAYSQMLEVSTTTLEQATRIAGTSATFSEDNQKPSYDWYQYTYNPSDGSSTKKHLGTAMTAPAVCRTGGSVSCTAEFTNEYIGDSAAIRDIDIDEVLDLIANDPQTRSILGELSPTCDIANDARCINAVVTKPGTADVGDEEVRLQLTANIPTIFLKYVYGPILGRDFIQLSATTTKPMETNFLQQSPLIFNHGKGVNGSNQGF